MTESLLMPVDQGAEATQLSETLTLHPDVARTALVLARIRAELASTRHVAGDARPRLAKRTSPGAPPRDLE